MGQALELIAGFTTAASTTATALTMCTGNSLTIRSADIRSRVSLLATWANEQADGYYRIRSPRLHDNNQGIRIVTNASTPSPTYPFSKFRQPLIPQDVLVVENTGSGTSGDIEHVCLLVHYEDLPGVSGRFISPDQLNTWGVNMMGQEVSLSLGTSGDYSGEVAINALSGCDQWKANTDYALVGGVVAANFAACRIRGVDTGNIGLGFPANAALPHDTAQWFVDLSNNFGLPLIPVINAANRQAVFVDGAQDENGTDSTVTLFLVELKPATART